MVRGNGQAAMQQLEASCLALPLPPLVLHLTRIVQAGKFHDEPPTARKRGGAEREHAAEPLESCSHAFKVTRP